MKWEGNDLTWVPKNDVGKKYHSKIVHQVGGSLGLWLGLGVLQVLQQINTITVPILKKFVITLRPKI